MKNTYINVLGRLMLLFALMYGTVANACTGGTLGSSITMTGSWATQSVQDGTYYTFYALSGSTYQFSFCGNGGSASFDTQISILDNSGSQVAYNDDYCGLQSYLSWTCSTSGTYRVLINTYNCQSYGNSATLAFFGPAASPCTNPVTAGTIVAPSGACTGQNFGLTLSGTTIGSGLTYQWMSSTNGTTFSNISGATNSNYSGMQSGATYYVCQVACSGGTPAYSDTIYLDMNPFYNCYCPANSSYGTSGGYYAVIHNVGFNTLNNSTTYPASSPYSTTYAPAGNLTTSVFTGSSYTFSITTQLSYTGVWFDWDQNGIYDATEYFYCGYNSSSSPQTFTVTVPVPTTAVPGQTGMRVRSEAYFYSLSSTNACTQLYYGETENYTINVVTPPADDAGIAAINSPSFPACTIDSNICVTLQNFGTDTLTSATISYSVNGGTFTSYSWTGMIPPLSDDTVCVTIGSANFQVGDNLTVVANNPNGSTGTYTANDTMSLNNMNVSLQGTYTIPGNYATINAAIDAMNAYGVCDHVIFDIASGVYDEHMYLGNVLGMSENATVTFQSATGDTADVTIQFTGNYDTNAVVKMNNASWFRFKNITFYNPSTSYGRVFHIYGQSNNNILDSNRIVSTSVFTTSDYNAVIYSYGDKDNNNTYSNNTIENGSYALYLRGNGNTNGNHEVGTTISNNTIVNPYYMGMYLYYQQGIEVLGNDVSSSSTYTGYGVYCYDCDNGMNISYNKIYGNENSSWPYYGLYTGFSEGSAQGFSYVTNNIVSISTGYAAFYQYYSDLMYVANNTFTVRGGTSTTSRAYYAYYSDFYFTNNNLCSNFGAGQAAAYYYGTPFAVDNNAYFSLGSQPFYYNGMYLNDLGSFQTSSNLDANALWENANFADTVAGILCNEALDGAGVTLAYVTDDFEHVVRNASTPDVGAREFVALSNFSLSSDTICGGSYEVFGPVNSATWSVDGNQSTGLSVMLTAGNTPQTFNVGISFSSVCNLDTATGLPIPVTASGTYRLVPAANLDANMHLCAGDQATLSPGGGANASYVWFPTNETSSTITVSTGGVYAVTKMEEGCESSATTVVTQSDGVMLLDAEACAVDLPYNVDATIVGGVSYAWSSGDNTAAVALNNSGTYTVTTTDVFGCTSTDSMMFEAIDVPVANIAETHTGSYYFFSSAASQNVGSNASYAWDFGDGSAPSTDANPQHQFPWTNPSAPTTFTVTLTIINDCGQDVIQMQTTPNTLGVNELEGGVSYSVYPNPSTGLVNIQFNGNSADQASLRVFDMTGRIVSETSANTNEIKSLDLSSVAAGTYVLEVNLNGTTSKTRISIQ